MTRTKPNVFALGCAVAYTLLFCLLPFYRILTFGLSGWMVMQYVNPILCIPLALGILMVFASLILDARISIGAGALAFLVTFVLMLCGGAILTNGNALTALASSAVTQWLGLNVGALMPVSIGVGAILCILFSVGFVGAEIVVGMQKPPDDIPGPITGFES
jgi:hypothetical protein